MRVFFGHHKCASQWMSDIFRQLCIQAELSYVKCTDSRYLEEKLQKLPSDQEGMLFYTNADYRTLADLPEFRGVHLIRDPRDVCISAYYSHRYSHPTQGWPELEAHRRRLESLNFEEGLLLDMAFCDEYLSHMGIWNYDDPRIMELRFEEVTTHPLQHCLKIISHLGMEEIISPESVAEAVEKNGFRQKSKGRKQGSVDTQSHYRSGLSDQWQTQFSAKHKDFFNKQYGWILDSTNYGE